MKYVVVLFISGGKEYTYGTEIVDLKPGDRLKVTTRDTRFPGYHCDDDAIVTFVRYTRKPGFGVRMISERIL